MAEDADVADDPLFLRGLKPTDVSLLQRVAEEAAERAVKKTFLIMGIDPENPTESQADFVFLRDTRIRCKGVVGKLIAAGVVVVVGITSSALAIGIRALFLGKS